MTPEQTRIQADLSGLIAGDVHCDSLFAQMYASDASVYELPPLGVVRPRTTTDVSKVLEYAAENELSIFPRGGGSGLAGQSLGRGLVLDFSRYMRRIGKPDNNRVRVQCGVVQADLNRQIGYDNWLFGPDPATRSVSSIGSMLAVDAAGSHFPRYGSAGDCVESLQVVLPGGEVIELGQHEWASNTESPTSTERIAQEVGLLLQKSSALILRPPWSGVARGCGFRIEKVLDGDRVNLARLMCGSEGTLGIITEATLRIEKIPRVRGLCLLFFSRLEVAARAALDLGKEEIAACDLMDRRLLEIARETEPVYESTIPRGAEAMLLLEIQGEEPAEVRSRLQAIQQRLQRRGKPVMSFRITTDSQERNLLWRLARRVIPRLYRLKGNMRPLPFVEDIAVPPKKLPEFLLEVQNILKSERTTATLFAHALHGHLDVRPFLDLGKKADQLRLTKLSDRLYEKVLEYGGCIAGQHALGISRAAWAERQLGTRLELFRNIKRAFDPDGILNPGKFLSPTPSKVNENLRTVPAFAAPAGARRERSSEPTGNAFEAAEAILGNGLEEQLLTGDLNRIAWDESLPVETPPSSREETNNDEQPTSPESSKQTRLPLLLDWQPGESIEFTARSCNGCGRCRTSASAERMCPVFRVHKGEEASPRAHANLLRGVLTGSLEPEELESLDYKQISDLCFNCHQCRIDCPASVNVPKLVQEAKAQHVASHGLPLSERLLNRVDLIASLASRFPKSANWALENRTARWLLEKTLGIAQGRKLPRIARKTFQNWASRKRLNRLQRDPGRKVLYFVDQYANWHNPMLGRAVVEVLQHHNIACYVPSGQTPSHMAVIAAGDIVRAKKMIQPNIRLLSEAVRQGYDIVTSEPSAALCLKEEYRNIVDNEDTRLIAENTYEICSYLWSLHTRNELELDLKPVNMQLLYHQPCHARVLDARKPALNLLGLVPALQLQVADAGCSGMAGTFGLTRKNFRTSVRIGRDLIGKIKQTKAQLGTTECSTCKLQMEQGVSKPTVHPVAILAYAYGRMPELKKWFDSRNEGSTVK